MIYLYLIECLIATISYYEILFKEHGNTLSLKIEKGKLEEKYFNGPITEIRYSRTLIKKLQKE